jgi:hypothetical protein
MPLLKLLPGNSQVDVQETTFGIDAIARFICSTWQKATANGGPPFDAVIIGAGMFGAYCATKIFRLKPGKRILLLDAGQYLVTEHVQNLANIGFGIPAAIPPANDPGIARDLVWGLPWRGNTGFPGLAYCLGGKSLFWGGWCPEMTAGDLGGLPMATAAYLTANYSKVAEETGVTPKTDFISGTLYSSLRSACITACAGIPNIETAIGANGVEDAPLAVQGAPPASGLFSLICRR